MHCCIVFQSLYSQDQSRVIKTTSYLARWIIRSHTEYAIEIGSSCNCEVSQGRVETYLRVRWRVFTMCCTKFPQESDSERILLSGLHLPKLWSKVKCIVFLTHSVVLLMYFVHFRSTHSELEKNRSVWYNCLYKKWCNNNNNNRDDICGAVIMAKPLREFTRFIW